MNNSVFETETNATTRYADRDANGHAMFQLSCWNGATRKPIGFLNFSNEDAMEAFLEGYTAGYKMAKAVSKAGRVYYKAWLEQDKEVNGAYFPVKGMKSAQVQTLKASNNISFSSKTMGNAVSEADEAASF